MKNKLLAGASQEILSIDSSSRRIITTSKPLSDFGELNLTLDEWHQAWRCLLELIDTFIHKELHLWEAHYNFIVNSENRSEMWSLYLAYDVEIRKRATQSLIDPSMFSIGVWNDLETRYTAKKVLNLVQADLKHDRSHSSHQPAVPETHGEQCNSRNCSHNHSFCGQHQHAFDKTGRCIFCGDQSRAHLSRNCTASSFANRAPCFLLRQEPTGTRQSKYGKRYCYAWNGPSRCGQSPCSRGDHACTLCGTSLHTAQQCTVDELAHALTLYTSFFAFFSLLY